MRNSLRRVAVLALSLSVAACTIPDSSPSPDPSASDPAPASWLSLSNAKCYFGDVPGLTPSPKLLARVDVEWDGPESEDGNPILDAYWGPRDLWVIDADAHRFFYGSGGSAPAAAEAYDAWRQHFGQTHGADPGLIIAGAGPIAGASGRGSIRLFRSVHKPGDIGGGTIRVGVVLFTPTGSLIEREVRLPCPRRNRDG